MGACLLPLMIPSLGPAETLTATRLPTDLNGHKMPPMEGWFTVRPARSALLGTAVLLLVVAAPASAGTGVHRSTLYVGKRVSFGVSGDGARVLDPTVWDDGVETSNCGLSGWSEPFPASILIRSGKFSYKHVYGPSNTSGGTMFTITGAVSGSDASLHVRESDRNTVNTSSGYCVTQAGGTLHRWAVPTGKRVQPKLLTLYRGSTAQGLQPVRFTAVGQSLVRFVAGATMTCTGPGGRRMEFGAWGPQRGGRSDQLPTIAGRVPLAHDGSFSFTRSVRGSVQEGPGFVPTTIVYTVSGDFVGKHRIAVGSLRARFNTGGMMLFPSSYKGCKQATSGSVSFIAGP